MQIPKVKCGHLRKKLFLIFLFELFLFDFLIPKALRALLNFLCFKLGSPIVNFTPISLEFIV